MNGEPELVVNPSDLLEFGYDWIEQLENEINLSMSIVTDSTLPRHKIKITDPQHKISKRGWHEYVLPDDKDGSILKNYKIIPE